VIYKNREIVWTPNPRAWDYTVGHNRPVETAAEAENSGRGTFVDIPLARGDSVVIVADDCQDCYHDNEGEINLSISIIGSIE
jgi:hypothetical protein